MIIKLLDLPAQKWWIFPQLCKRWPEGTGTHQIRATYKYKPFSMAICSWVYKKKHLHTFHGWYCWLPYSDHILTILLASCRNLFWAPLGYYILGSKASASVLPLHLGPGVAIQVVVARLGPFLRLEAREAGELAMSCPRNCVDSKFQHNKHTHIEQLWPSISFNGL